MTETWTAPVPQAALNEHIGIVGKTGSGKTFAAKGMVEALLAAGKRVCVLDPIGVWWGLRATADGEPSDFPVIVAGGDHGDVPLHEDAGKQLGHIVATEALSWVVDTSDFSNAARHRFLQGFLGEAYRSNRRPLYLVVDEADELAPQNPLPETRRVAGAMDRIVRRGRARGFRVTMITQRPAVVHKNVLTQIGTLVAMRLTGPQDRNALKAWVEGHADVDQGKEVLGSLAALERGEGWIWSPGLDVLERAVFPVISTFDSSRTPEDDDELTVPTLAAVDLGALAERLRPEEPEDEVPKGRSKQSAKALKAEFERGRQAGAQGSMQEIERLREELAQARQAGRDLANGILALQKSAEALSSSKPPPQPAALEPKKLRNRGSARVRVKAEATSAGDALPSGARKILEALATQHPRPLTWQQVAALAGLKPTGGHWNNARKTTVDKRLVDETGHGISLSNQGVRIVGQKNLGQPITGADLVELWANRLKSPAGEMLHYLYGQACSGRSSDRESMARALGKQPTGGHWNSGLAVLRKSGLIEDRAGRLSVATVFLEVDRRS